MLALNTSLLYLSVGYNTFRLSVNRCALNISLFCYLACAPLAVLQGFGEVVGFDDVGGVEVGDSPG